MIVMTPREIGEQLIGLQCSLKKFAYSLSQDSDYVNDLLQETNLRTLSSADNFEYKNDESLRIWTFTIMKNIFLNDCHKKKNRKTDVVDTDLYLSSLNHETNLEGPDSYVHSGEIKEIIAGLDEGFKIPFEMCIEGYTYKEIADGTGLKIGTVKTRIFGARKKLTGVLKDYEYS